ncbi:MAG: CARDB domain-containing protein, partial [Myxococcota bacterium]
AADVLTGPDFLIIGAESTFPVHVINLHRNPLGPFAVSLEAALTADFADPRPFGTASGVRVMGFQRERVDVPVVPPPSFGTNPIFVRATVDSTNVVAEVAEANNVVEATAPTQLLPGAADLAVEEIIPRTTFLAAGEMLTVDTRVRNIGSETADDVSVRIVLSGNAVISRQDVRLGDFRVSLAPGEAAMVPTTVAVPTTTNSGPYFVGALADADEALVELSEINNAAASPTPVTITGDDLAVSTVMLPRGCLRVPYVGLLEAVGATADTTWRILQGVLPQGLTLFASTGEIVGQPQRAETQTFTVEAASNGRTATAELLIRVSAPDEALTIVTRTLPTAVVGQEYDLALRADGAGTIEPTWSARGLPPGLQIHPQGTIFGIPTAPGARQIELVT